MKKFYIFILSLSLISCFSKSAFAIEYLRTPIPLKGSTLLPYNMQAIVLGNVYSKVYGIYGRCKDFSIVDTKVTKDKKDIVKNRYGREVGGNWSEVWTVDACGYNISVPIDFETQRHGVKFDIKKDEFKY